ncbi:hypothetical protein HK105_208062 [Polyrhizophydium stewartii]|uniref:PLAC8 family protein n=1 Tax=Polyrhizophydium stewartii TaxID=2732419 RepID=A0ABR4MZ20_9FUNG
MAYAQQPMMQPMMQPVMGVPTTTKQNLNHASGCIGWPSTMLTQRRFPAIPFRVCIQDCIVGCLMAYIGCWCCLGGSNRSTIRAKYNIMGDSCADCCIHTFCATCALTQEKREVEAMMAAGRN